MTTPHPNTTQELDDAINACADEIGWVGKEKTSGLNYAIRGWDAVVANVAPVMRKHGLRITVDDHPDHPVYDYENNRCVMAIEVTIKHRSGQRETVTRTGSHPLYIVTGGGKKIMNNNPESAARTYAHRDAVERWFLIPTMPSPELTDEQNTVTEPHQAPRLDPEKAELVNDVYDFLRRAKRHGSDEHQNAVRQALTWIGIDGSERSLIGLDTSDLTSLRDELYSLHDDTTEPEPALELVAPEGQTDGE